VDELPGRNTLFLEGVDELPSWAQIQLLDLVESSWLPNSSTEVSRLGTVRVIASTTADLKETVAGGRFQRALYDHMNVVPIRIPPLRERREDIQPLAVHFVEQFCRSQNQNSTEHLGRLSKEGLNWLEHYPWPGNVRELAGVLARLVLLGECFANDKTWQDQQETATPDSSETLSVPLSADFKAMERHIIREVVKRHGGNKAAAARALGLHRRTLYRVLEKGKRNTSTDALSRQPVIPHC